MSIENQIETILNNVPQVYDSGYSNGYNKGTTFGYEDGYSVGRIDGKQDEQLRFFTAYFNHNNRGYMKYQFASRGWNDETFYPTEDITPTNAQGLFNECVITDLVGRLRQCGVVLDTSNCEVFSSIFYNTTITHIPTINMEKARNDNTYIFAYCRQLHTIDKIVTGENSGALLPRYNQHHFENCTNLQNIVIEGKVKCNITFQWSSKLTIESLKSIIESLVDVKGTDEEFKYTLTLHADSHSLLDNNTVLIKHKTTNAEMYWRDYLTEIGWILV